MTRFTRRQPLAGIVDGSNKVFLCPTYPVLAAGFVLYLGATVQTLTTQYTLDTSSGVVTFGTAPAVQPTADYTAIQLSQTQMNYYNWAGFNLMESLWARKYMLSSSATSFTFASPTDTNMYVCQGPVSSGAVPTDPLAGSLTFSTSQAQRGWLERCAEFAYLDSMSSEAALSDVDVTERVGGIRIATSHRSQNIVKAKQEMWCELLSSMYSALDEWDSSGAHYGSAAAQIHSNYYTQTWNWQNNNGILAPTSMK